MVERRTILQRCGAGFATAITTGLAGCGGSGGGAGTNSNTDGESPAGGTNGPQQTGESGLQRTFSIFPESVDEAIELVAVEEAEVTNTYLEVNVTLRNTSDEATRMDEYSIVLIPYPTEDPTIQAANRITTGSASIQYNTADQEPTPPGETVTLGYSYEVTEDADTTIKSYAISIGCPGVGSPPGCE